MLRKLAFPMMMAAALLVAGCNSNSSGSTPSTTGAPGTQSSGDKIKIGFLVKSATEPWFQTEWKFADEAAAKYGFELIKQEVKDGDKVSSALDDLGVKGAQGVIICTPDQKLGPMIEAKAKEENLKLLTVDDQLMGPDNQPLKTVHHLGIKASDIGKMVGQALVDEMKARNWNMAEVGAIAVNTDTLETARQRIDGSIEVLTKAGFPAGNIYKSPWKTFDIPGGLDAANITLTQHPNIKHWIAFSSNDDGVLGAVRATEQRGLKAEDVIGIGINGTSGVDDLKKNPPTGFFASVLLSARKHGYGTAEAMYQWIKDGKEPAMETWTDGILINRSNFAEKMKAEGL